MSFTSGQRQFTIGTYAQSGLVMDWFGLTDPFTQTVPLKVANAYSGTIWIQGQLNSPPSGYYSYSGINLGLVNSGSNNTLTMTWNRGISGWIASSSPVTDSLTLGLIAFTSSNYTGAIDSGTLSFSNVLFNRYSGVIKVFGEIYNNDNPSPALSLGGGVGFVSGQLMSYAVSYILSGWESDISAPASITTGTPSGANQISASWNAITGVTQYFVWRWSGNNDHTLYDNAGGFLSGTMDLQVVTTSNSYTDTNLAPARTALYRHRSWATLATVAANDSVTYLSSPSSRRISGNTIWSHSFYLSRNASGSSTSGLLGPLYAVFHLRPLGVSGYSLALATGEQTNASGVVIADVNALSGLVANTWYRHTVMLGSSGSLSASGKVAIQVMLVSTGSLNGVNVDDVFVVANS